MKFIGHIICPQDGYTYITDSNQVVIYYSPDSSRYLTEVKCGQCGKIVEGNIDREFFVAFKAHGVKIRGFGTKFPNLTDSMIEEWDIEGDLQSLNGD